MTTALADYHSCTHCGALTIDVGNTTYRKEFQPKPDPANEAFLFYNLTLADIQKGASAGCVFFKWLISEWSSANVDSKGEWTFGEESKLWTDVLPRADTVYLYATTFSSSVVNLFPLDEISFFGLWNGESMSSKSEPKILIRTVSPMDVLTTDGWFETHYRAYRDITLTVPKMTLPVS
jgi:hypothetical protein